MNRSEPTAGARDYSPLDRALHRVAFAHPFAQRAIGEIENDLFAAQLNAAPLNPPVFVTGLPRAGTTLLLELLHSTGEFATFTYRNMPFVLAPLLWDKIAAPFRQDASRKERAHGDGVAVSLDSPEAFEEVLWLAFFERLYVRPDRLVPIASEMLTAEFRAHFSALARKLAAARGGGGLRYLSKNNANLARLGALAELFPERRVFVCVREPAAHVASLMAQHARFLALHRRDRFARDYMRWIGHFDFGANFRPIDFAGRGLGDPECASADFWLQYWIDAYAFADRRADAATSFFCYDSLFEAPERALRAIAAAAALKDPDGFAANAPRIRPPTSAPASAEAFDPARLEEARRLHQRLRARALA
jgi:hypothetical protein